ncbi:MAG: hypothetical protein CSA21_06105 [Deltaproteobacteria bacterium]|nr:MAG: hypothetical protein CSA21_06105 [Deltaproteobacteria bacterium]
MSPTLKTLLLVMMVSALTFGFLHHLTPPEVHNLERLHIFLFNLCSGGTLLLYFTENRRHLSWRGKVFLGLALAFALCAFFQWYLPAMLIPLVLAVVVEAVRVSHFGTFLPRALFTWAEPVYRKFHQAALLCLSIGLVLSSLVILNDTYLHWYVNDKLELNTFFLGFSFPVSLISMSVIFSLMDSNPLPLTRMLRETAFWVVNLGVIIFFLFILAQMFIPQVVISVTLFACVVMILHLYYRHGLDVQQKAFLTSGILFLTVTAITGISYILLEFSSYYTKELSEPLLRLHTFTALYGWNLSGLAVISRHDDFPIQLHSKPVISLHWLTVLVLCPLGYFFPLSALLAVLAYGWLLVELFFRQGRVDRDVTTSQTKSISG